MLSLAQNDNRAQQALEQSNDARRARQVADLKAIIRHIEYGAETQLSDPLATAQQSGTGINLETGLLHEIWADTPMSHAAATGFILSKLDQERKPFLWIIDRQIIRDYGFPYGPGLLAHELNLSRLMIVRTRRRAETLWVMEEALKLKCLEAVIGEVTDIALKESRRLALAAATNESRSFLLLRRESAPSSTAYSRWRVQPRQSAAPFFVPKAPGKATVTVALHKHKGGVPPFESDIELVRGDEGPFNQAGMEQDATDYINLAPALAG